MISQELEVCSQCGDIATWQHNSESHGMIAYCHTHAELQPNFGKQRRNQFIWRQLRPV